MSTAIEFNNISKLYRLGLVSTGTLSHDLKRWWTVNVRRREDPYMKIGEVNDRSSRGGSDYVWALKDIDFKVEQGDVVGIIGKNGAGKSTLLKILSRVTAPTTGSIRAKGRIGSLLEVGTGFHPEMTGRENIYMNGAILGMSKAEITRKLDEIIDFSGCERYIDTPVKRYSSGMMVRLGFAVAAHLDPEILVVDEVLAVGDAEFQKRAIGKMQEVSKGEGRTVLFVSHNMTAVRNLCQRGILLENGRMVADGDVNSVVSAYLRGGAESENHKAWPSKPAVARDGFELIEVGIRKRGGSYDDPMCVSDELELTIRYRLTQPYPRLHITWHVKNEQGNAIFSMSGVGRCVPLDHPVGEYEQTCIIPADFFNWGNFGLDLFVVKNLRDAVLIEYDLLTFALVSRVRSVEAYQFKEPGDVTPQFDFFEQRHS